MSDVSLRSLRKSFGAAEIISGIDLDIADGEFIVFVGPSGCGKSTLLRMIAGLENITSGDLRIGGVRCNDLPPKERGIAMVFQSYALYPHKSVRGNLAFGLRVARFGKEEIERRVASAAAALEITHLLDRKPAQLSGGQRQRVAIGRSIVREPKVFLFDEPLSNLDASLRVNMRMEIARLHRELGTTVIYVTHDQVEAMTLADRIVVMDHGKVRQIGTPLEVYKRPADQFVAGFLGSPRMNFLDARVVAAAAGAITLSGPGFATGPIRFSGPLPRIGTDLVIGIRPEDLQFSGGESAPRDDGLELQGKVAAVERLGSASHIALRLNDGSLIMKIGTAFERASLDEQRSVTISPELLHFFGPDGRAILI